MPRDGVSLGLSTFVLASPFSDADLPLLADVRTMGYDQVEVCIEDPRQLSAAAVGRAAADEGLSVLVCGAFGPDRDLSNELNARRRDGIAYLRGCVDFAAAVASPLVSGPMFAPTGQARLLPPDERAAQWSRARDSLAEVADYAADAEVTLAIEPLNRFETDMVNTVEQGLRLCGDIGAANVGLLLDTFHMNIEEKSIPEAIRAAGPRLVHFQAAENDRGIPGSGHIDWTGALGALRDVRYSGSVVVESFLPEVVEIARAVSLWRPVAPSMTDLARDAASFLLPMLNPGSDPQKRI